MILHRLALNCLLFLPLLFGETIYAHGGVVEEDDLCIIKVSYLRAHFKIYQPLVSGHEQFCEDIPAASESVFVMEYQHDALATMPVDFRIIRDVTGKGRFARIEDVEQIGDLNAATVYYRAPTIEPDVYSVIHAFEEEGAFIGIVSVRHPESGRSFAAVFPFEVGFTGAGYWPYIVGLLILLQLQYLFMSGRLRRWPGRSATGVMLLMLALPASAQDLVLSFTTPDGEIEINRMHSWVLHVENANGEAIEGAEVTVDGGMPAHNHGLPTRPRVTAELGGGDYRIDGMRFHMRGKWRIVVTVVTDDGTSTGTITLNL